jgi:L-threonylcarbamoyladenylate synthase
LICLVANDAMLERHIEKVPELAYEIMDLSTKPTTIVYDRPKAVALNLIASDNTLAVRVASDKFCKYLINKFRKPIVSTSANVSGRPSPAGFREISETILKGVDYVVDLQSERPHAVPSSIIKLGNDGTVKVIRE